MPENALARSPRDAAGELSQLATSVLDEAYLTVASQPLRLKRYD